MAVCFKWRHSGFYITINSMFIRLSNHQDISKLADVERSAAKKFAEYFKTESVLNGRTLGTEILLEAHHNQSLWVAIEQDTILGFLAATNVDTMLHIQEISVAFEHQGKGIGKKLINEIIVESKKRKIPYVSLTTDSLIPWNKPFYERIGFKQIELEECPPELSQVLRKDKSHNPVPENRIAMAFEII